MTQAKFQLNTLSSTAKLPKKSWIFRWKRHSSPSTGEHEEVWETEVLNENCLETAIQ